MKYSICLIALTTALAAGCGGGGGDGTSDSAPLASGGVLTPDLVPSVATDTTPTAISLGNCFLLTPGIEYLTSAGSHQSIVQESFEGSNAFAQVESTANGKRVSASYNIISGGVIHQLGINRYDQGVFIGKHVYSSGAQISVNMEQNKGVIRNYFNTLTTADTSAKSITIPVTDQITLVGVEELTLGGHVFSDTCKFKEDKVGQTRLLWIAQGFGLIKTIAPNAKGEIQTIELTTIVNPI